MFKAVESGNIKFIIKGIKEKDKVIKKILFFIISKRGIIILNKKLSFIKIMLVFTGYNILFPACRSSKSKYYAINRFKTRFT